ncbi:MAG TPA: DivIVA domain-containing protein [Cytophagaceae bacterium]
MKITPIEIRQKDFEKAFRGYEKDEVDAFLLSLSQEWERIIDENKELKRRLESAEKEVSRLRDVENSLFRTLKTAEDTGANLIEQANKTADLHIKEAQMNAEAIMNEARSKAKSMIEEAEEKAKEIVDELQSEVKAIEVEYKYIDNQRENLLQELKSFVNDTLEKVNRYSAKKATDTFDKKLREIRGLVAEQKAKLDRQEENFVSYTKPVQRTEPKVTNEVKNNTSIDNKESDKQDKSSGSFFDNIEI